MESLPPVYSIRAWTADGYPAQIAFNEEMRATGVDVIDIFPAIRGCTTFGEWAERAVAEILDQHPEDTPLHLVGYCFGGSVVHVALCELERRGISPEYVGMISVRELMPAVRLARGYDSVFDVPWAQRLRFQLVRLTPPDRESIYAVLESVARRMVTSGREFAAGNWKPATRRSRKLDGSRKLWANWENNSVVTPIHSYVSANAIAAYWPGDPSIGRSALMKGGFVIRSIEGTHETCIEPPFSAGLIKRINADRRAVVAGNGAFR